MLVGIKAHMRSNVMTFASFFAMLTSLVVVFSLAGKSTGRQLEGIQTIMAFGDPRTTLPLAFSFLLGVSLQMIFPHSQKVSSVAAWIVRFGRDGYFIFFALVFSLAIGTWTTSLFPVLLTLALPCLFAIITVSALEAFAEKSQDPYFKAILGVGLFSAVVVLPFLGAAN